MASPPLPGEHPTAGGTLSPCLCPLLGGINPSGCSGPGHSIGPFCCPSVPRPSLCPVPTHGSAAAAARPHLGLIFHAKPHSPLGCSSRSRNPAGAKGAAQGLAQDVVAQPGGKQSWRGSGGELLDRSRGRRNLPPRRSPRPRQEQPRRGPGEGITPSWKHVLPSAP